MNSSSLSASVLRPETLPKLLANDTPLIDVRAPVEFARGRIPGASNLPLLNDEERSQVGTCYKNRGREAAITLGHELVSGETREQRLQRWIDLLESHPNAVLYCFRGGQRSRIAQQWLDDAGYPVPRLAGGYKASRNWFIEKIETAAREQPMLIVGGKTGTAKTHLLGELGGSIDLEGLANHRGSAFGRRSLEQPSQSDFENQLAAALVRLNPNQRLILEDEGRAIGSVHIPNNFHQAMSEAPLALIEASLEARIDTIWFDYIKSNFADFIALNPATAEQRLQDFLLDSLQRIQRRLGGDRYLLIKKLMVQALQQQFSSGDDSGHRIWIESLLSDYYDPMYEYQLAKKSHRIVFRGSREEFLRWAGSLDGRSLNTIS